MGYSLITSKTHRFISVRNYPSDYMLKKFHEGDRKAQLLMSEIAEKYYDFYKNFIEFATGNPYKYYMAEYFLGAKESSTEELHELTGILIASAGNYEIYCIPKSKENDRLFDFIVENVPCKFKIIKKTRGTYTDYGPQKWVRNMNRTKDDEIREIMLNSEAVSYTHLTLPTTPYV